MIFVLSLLESIFQFSMDRLVKTLPFFLIDQMDCPKQNYCYQFVSDQSQKSLKVYPSTIQLMNDISKGRIYNFVFAIKAQSPSSVKYIGNIALSFVITVKVEHFKELIDMVLGKDRVFGNNILEINYFSLLLDLLFFKQHFQKNNDNNLQSQYLQSSIYYFYLQLLIKYLLDLLILSMLYSTNKICSSPFQSSSKKKKKDIDRFIPHSVSKNLYSMFQDASSSTKNHKKQYENILHENLRTTVAVGKVLSFTEEKEDKENMINIENISNIQNKKFEEKKSRGPVKNQPYKILEAPCLRDDFYLNLVDWSDNDCIGVGLQTSLYVWSGCTSKVKKVFQSENIQDYLCSVSFLKHNNKVSVGFTDGGVKIFDLYKSRKSSQFQNLHYGRIGSLGCSQNLICTGGRDGYVTIQDFRQQKEIMRYKAHNQQICGLKLNSSADIIATGGNDNKLVLFSLKKMNRLISWDQHQAAVKAIGFNPNEPTITSGAGTADRKLRVFSLNTLKMINQVDTGSQICNLLYSPVSNELVTTHGYSLNQINLWKCGPNGSLQKIDSMMGHRSRVLYLAGQSTGGKMVTGAGDEQLRLWKIFDEKTTIVPYDLR